MKFDKNDFEWLITLIVTIWLHYNGKKPLKKKKAPKKRKK